MIYFQVKMTENGKKNIFRDKQTTKKIPLILSTLKCFPKGSNYVFGFYQKTTKVQFMYLAFTNAKIGPKKDQQWSES